MAEAWPIETAAACCAPADRARLAAWWRIGLGAVIAVNAMTVDLALNTSAAPPGDRAVAHAVTLLATVLTFALLGWPLLRNAARELARRRVTIEAAFIVGITGAFVASLVAVIGGEGAVYFEVVSVLLVVYAVGQQVTGAVRDRALGVARLLAPQAVTCEVVGEDGTVTTLPAAEVKRGMRVRLAPGAMVPVDGVVVSGEGFVREAEMTGEHFAVVKRPGDAVWAGTGNVDAALLVEASAAGCERRIDHILDAVERARLAPSSLLRVADRLAAWFVPAVLLVALATMAAWTAARGWPVGLFNAMAVLLIACPCAVGLATPLAAWAAIGALARRGLIVRSGDAVERLAAAGTVVFDKTGTLTERRARLLELGVAALDDLGERQVRAVLEAVERCVDHPVAAAFHGVADGVAERVTVDRLRLLPGAGVEAEVGVAGRRRVVRIGLPERLLADDHLRRAYHALAGPRAAGARRVVVLVDGAVAAAATVGEEVRESWPEALGALQERGVRGVIMSGDAAARVHGLGIAEVHAGLTPEDKHSLLSGLRAVGGGGGEEPSRRRSGEAIVYVGDGVNDAAAMAAADVGIAVDEGAALVGELADVVWHGGDLRTLPWAIDRCRSAVRTIRSNLTVAVFYNVVGIGLAAAGVLHPVVAALLMTGSSLVVTLRAMGGDDGGLPSPAAGG